MQTQETRHVDIFYSYILAYFGLNNVLWDQNKNQKDAEHLCKGKICMNIFKTIFYNNLNKEGEKNEANKLGNSVALRPFNQENRLFQICP